jgi:flavin-dependent dehydrogenase
MKWLIHLYPEKWKKHYGDEFLYILENRNLSFKEVIDVIINAMDARFLNLVEGLINMDKKIRDVMLGSVLNRFLIIGSVIFIGTLGGYWIGNNTPSIFRNIT